MGTRFAAGLVVALVLAALIIGLMTGVRSALEAPEVVSAIAEQEQARAFALRAEALEQYAQAQKAASDAATWRANEPARRYALDLVSWGLGWGLAIAAAVVLVGGSLAVVRAANVRALTVYPNAAGAWPVLVERQTNKALAVLDIGRLVGPVAIIGQDGQVQAPGLASEPAQVQITSQAQAAGVMGAALRSQAGLQDNVRERVSAGLRSTVATLSAPAGAPTFASGAPSAPMSSTRFVYVKAPKGNSEHERDLADLREFIGAAGVRGLGRRSWLGYKFKSGHECTRSRYDALTEKLRAAGVVVAAGQSWRLAVSEAEALDAFGLGERDLDNQARSQDDAEGGAWRADDDESAE